MASPKKGGKSTQILPKKAQEKFDKRVLKLYEQEKFENAISAADEILKDFPDHGETMVMRGLCLTTMAVGIRSSEKPPTASKRRKGDSALLGPLISQEKKDELFAEGMSFVQRGLSKNMTSSMCWRVKGVAHKSLGEFIKALQCYKQALKCKGNVADKNTRHRILAEMCSLQISLHLWSDLSESRNELYMMNPTDKSSAIQYMCSLFISNKFDECYQFIQKSILGGSHKLSPIAYSDCLIVSARCLLNAGKYRQCLRYLSEEKQSCLIKDQLSRLRIILAVYRKQQDIGGQQSTLMSMIEINPEHTSRIKELLRLVGFYDLKGNVNYQEKDDALRILMDVDGLSLKANSAVKRLRLSVTPARNEMEQTQFRDLIHSYLKKKLMRSVMSLYKDIKELYNESGKAMIIDDLCNEYLKNLSDNKKCKFLDTDDDRSASPACLVWLLYLLTNRKLDLNDFNSALKYCNQALDLCPTSPDLYDLKGRVYKYGGNTNEAYLWLNQGRELDLADRFINTKCVRYALRNHMYNEAQMMVHLFTKRSEGQKVLNTLQVNWFELAKAECHDEMDEYGPGLRYYDCVYEHFVKFHDNSLYFNRYAARSDFPLTCMQCLKWDLTLSSHPFYKRAIRGAIHLWLRLLDCKQRYPDNESVWCKGSSPMNRLDKQRDTIEDPRGHESLFLKDPLIECDKFLELAMVIEHENTNAFSQSGDDSSSSKVFNLFTQTLNILVNGHSDWFSNEERIQFDETLKSKYPLYKLPNRNRERRAFGSVVNGCAELSQRFAQRRRDQTSKTGTTDASSSVAGSADESDKKEPPSMISSSKVEPFDSDNFPLLEDEYEIDQTVSRSDESDFIVACVELIYRMDNLLTDAQKSHINDVSLQQTTVFSADDLEKSRPYPISTLPLAKQSLFNLCNVDSKIMLSMDEVNSSSVKSAVKILDVIKVYSERYCEEITEYCAVYRSLNVIVKDCNVDSGICQKMMTESIQSMIKCINEASLKECMSCFRYVLKISAEDSKLLADACKVKYPFSTVFDGPAAASSSSPAEPTPTSG